MWPERSEYSSSTSNPGGAVNFPNAWVASHNEGSRMYKTDCHLGALIVISHLSDDQLMMSLTPQPSLHPILTQSREAVTLQVPLLQARSHNTLQHIILLGDMPRPPGEFMRYPPPIGPAGYQGPPGPPPLPPTGQQQYGLQPVPGGQMQPAYFQYSQCNGKKKALLIGINYIGQPEALQGCIEDVHRMKRFLLGRGYRAEDMVILADNSPHPREQPTQQNMIDAMHWLVRDARPNDSLFFHFIYPVDFKVTSHIVDDDMHRIMVSGLPAGCRLTAIFDVSDLKVSCLTANFSYSTEGKIKEPNVTLGAAKGLLSTFSSFQRNDVGGMVHGVTDLLHVASGRAEKANQYTRATRSSVADVISWSGCKDSQTSADAQIGGRNTGAMSDAFLTVLARNPNPSYQQLLIEMSEKYSQKPQFSSSHPIDTNLQFIV
ncbi:putative metacaspase [Lanmaoa asiatica]|nr:putative metacaspase [Lanmaoa asiatica]